MYYFLPNIYTYISEYYFQNYYTGFLRCFRDPIRVPRIENRVPRIRENYHRVPRIENRVPRIRKNYHRVPRIRENRALESENRVPTGPYRAPYIFLKKNLIICLLFNTYFISVMVKYLGKVNQMSNNHVPVWNGLALATSLAFRSTCASVEMLKGTWSEKGWKPLLYRESFEHFYGLW